MDILPFHHPRSFTTGTAIALNSLQDTLHSLHSSGMSPVSVYPGTMPPYYYLPATPYNPFMFFSPIQYMPPAYLRY
ncbi:hypothetical protein [Ectobacillus ponti]|uniref:Uncharacterized protein n=1 Tax=Ectobacillus ponti TaxID=2961894 RepID=A0AA41X8X5_9BACI|nr:hypothetical protein [Ectobacillus ponti]MCP8969303.1 hypothetical protein [Ectobacillus ponti]